MNSELSPASPNPPQTTRSTTVDATVVGGQEAEKVDPSTKPRQRRQRKSPSAESPEPTKVKKNKKIPVEKTPTEPTDPVSSLREQVSKLANRDDLSREQLIAVLFADPDENSLVTKQTTLRLEAKLLERLSKLCAKENLSREVLLEALFEHYEQDRSAKKKIIAQAKQKGERRLAIANRKRAKTMIERFN